MAAKKNKTNKPTVLNEDAFSQLPSVSRKRRANGLPVNETGFKSQELSSLYTLLKQFGTNESALEFVSACGLSRRLDDIREKVNEIRDLAKEAKAIQLEELKKKYKKEEKDIPEKTTKSNIYNNWGSTILSMTSHFRGYNHTFMNDVFTEAIEALPKDKFENVLVSESPMVKSKDLKMDVDFAKIQRFLLNPSEQTGTQFDLNSLESAVILKMMDELWAEAQTAIGEKEQAVIRGFLKRFKDKSNKEYSFPHPDFPCEEFTSTKVYLDPIRTRDWGILKDAREILREEVDVSRVNFDRYEPFEEEEEEQEQIPVFQIDPSEVNSMKYPPAPFDGAHALKPMILQTSKEEIEMDNLSAL